MIALSRRFTLRECSEIRRRAIFEAGKLDPQSYDEPTLAPFALRIAPSAWRELAELAERCAEELRQTESALRSTPTLWRALGIPPRLRAMLHAGSREAQQSDERHPRFARFDFHPTKDGWRVSEVNADVPGGFIEAGAITRIVREHLPDCVCPADPAAALARSIASRMNARGVVALVHATSYTDDQQVMRRIGAELGALGIEAHFAAPDHLEIAADGHCRLTTNHAEVRAVARFFPAEWLANLPQPLRRRWSAIDAIVPQANPLSALLIQSKRLPLVLPRLGVAMPTWMSVLPEVRAVGWRRVARSLLPDGFVLKPTWGRIGEGVTLEGVTDRRIALQSYLSARLFASEWLLQRRFASCPLGAEGIHACLGVYVVDGRAAGIYARVAPRALIDGRAQDAAVLIDPSLEASIRPTPAEVSDRSSCALISSIPSLSRWQDSIDAHHDVRSHGVATEGTSSR